MAFDTMTKEIKDKMAQKPGGGRGTNPNAPAFGQGKQLPGQMTPGAEPTAQELRSVNLNKKNEKKGKGGCCWATSEECWEAITASTDHPNPLTRSVQCFNDHTLTMDSSKTNFKQVQKVDPSLPLTAASVF